MLMMHNRLQEGGLSTYKNSISTKQYLRPATVLNTAHYGILDVKSCIGLQ